MMQDIMRFILYFDYISIKQDLRKNLSTQVIFFQQKMLFQFIS